MSINAGAAHTVFITHYPQCLYLLTQPIYLRLLHAFSIIRSHQAADTCQMLIGHLLRAREKLFIRCWRLPLHLSLRNHRIASVSECVVFDEIEKHGSLRYVSRCHDADAVNLRSWRALGESVVVDSALAPTDRSEWKPK